MRLIEQKNLSLSWLYESKHELEEGCFAGTVEPQHTQYFPSLYGKVYPLEGSHAMVVQESTVSLIHLSQSFNLDNGILLAQCCVPPQGLQVREGAVLRSFS